MTTSPYTDTTLAILAIDDSRPEDNDTAVFPGELTEEDGILTFADDTCTLELPEIFRARIKPVPEAVRDILLDCDYVLKLEVSPSGPDAAFFAQTGLPWPKPE